MKTFNFFIAERIRHKNKYEQKAILHGIGETIQLLSISLIGAIYTLHVVNVFFVVVFILSMYGVYEGSYIKNIEHITNMDDIREGYKP